MTTQQYRILISDSTYTSWTVQDAETNATIEIDHINPSEHHLFSKDVFSIDTNQDIQLVHSPVRNENISYAGILQLDNHKTYGRTANKKRLLYKCIPDDSHLPIFLVPYDLKLGFTKAIKNKYIVFRFDQWTQKHPYGIILETLGDTDNHDAFYEYQLYCKSLHLSLTDFTKNARDAFREKTIEEYVEQIQHNPVYAMDDRTHYSVFTIDPHHSLDYDDGFSIVKMGESTNPTYKMSIYIANVFVWLETLGLWNSFSKRVATIYLPDRRRPMLPTILSDELCSLQEKQLRFAFVMDMLLDANGQILVDPNGNDCISFRNAMVRVTKNYHYEEPDLDTNKSYQDLLHLTKIMDKTVKNSHDVVAYWMIQMNIHCAKYMVTQKMGIFRTVASTAPRNKTNNSSSSSSHDEDTERVMRMWNTTSGQYIQYADDVNLSHEFIDTSAYANVTSPIRRLVDLLNQLLLTKNLFYQPRALDVTPSCSVFLDNWLQKMEYINTSMRSIRKIQYDCDILHRCTNDPQILTEVHSGVVFDKMSKDESVFSYVVYLESLKILSRITTKVDLANCTRTQFKIYIFMDEARFKRKIRLQIIESKMHL